MNEIDFYKINETLNNKYYQIPQELFVNRLYKEKLNSDSKILYSFLLDSYVLPYYRNSFLANVKVNLNMIDTAGSGIRRVFNNQKQKFFPMSDYDLSVKGREKVILYGKILYGKYKKMFLK